MLRTQHLYTDAMAVIGVVAAILFCGAQALRTLSTTQGMSLAQYIAFTGSMVLGLLLAIGARKANPGRIINQQIAMLGTWSVCGIGLIIVVIYAGNYSWSTMDTVIATSAVVGFVLTMGWAFYRKVTLTDPAIKAWNGIFLKSVPQVFLAWHILSQGDDGLTATAVWAGHLSIMMRLIPLGVSVRVEGSDRNKFWLLIADGSNGLSWLLATIAWLVV